MHGTRRTATRLGIAAGGALAAASVALTTASMAQAAPDLTVDLTNTDAADNALFGELSTNINDNLASTFANSNSFITPGTGLADADLGDLQGLGALSENLLGNQLTAVSDGLSPDAALPVTNNADLGGFGLFSGNINDNLNTALGDLTPASGGGAGLLTQANMDDVTGFEVISQNLNDNLAATFGVAPADIFGSGGVESMFPLP
jgi:hypothetical protein